MPELPEIETIRRGLAPHLVGRTLTGISVTQPKLRRPVPLARLQALVGSRVVDIRRRSKYLLCEMEEGWLIVIHLGMSGRLLIGTHHDPMQQHTHISFKFDQFCVLFRDPRRFGFVAVLHIKEFEQIEPFASLGPEPLSRDFDAAYFQKSAQGSRQLVKAWLMDQKRVAGIGNIYANEALFRAGILPQRTVGTLDASEADRLVSSIKSVLQEAVELGGTTISDFVDSAGSPGYFQNRLAVYHRAGEPCSRCGERIEKMVFGGRSTFFCPSCQK